MRADRLMRLALEAVAKRYKVTAAQLAEELEVTVRTVYRDVATLVATGAPIRGERGVGYVLDSGYDVPPLMFDADELEALVLGARLVRAQADAHTARAAEDALAKITAVVPEERRRWLAEAPLFAVRVRDRHEDAVDLRPLRRAFREQRKARIAYEDARGRSTERVVWPLSLAFITERRSVVAWCEARCDFRHFRTDRLREVQVLQAIYPGQRMALLERWRVLFQAETGIAQQR